MVVVSIAETTNMVILLKIVFRSTYFFSGFCNTDKYSSEKTTEFVF